MIYRYTIFILFLVLIAGNVCGQSLSTKSEVSNRVCLNDVRKDEKILLKHPEITISVKSNRNEILSCQIWKGKTSIKEFELPLEYGISEHVVSLQNLSEGLQNGQVYHIKFQGKYFGKGSFDFYMELPPIMPTPIANIQVLPIDVHCDGISTSSVECVGGVQGGVAPYKLTWLVSKGPYIKDLINQPIAYELTNSADLSRLMVSEVLDLYITMLVEDACGNTDKRVMHLKCSDDEKDGMIHFQPIDLKINRTYPDL